MADSPSHTDEQFVRLLMKHETSVRAYIRSALPDAEETAEVMQRASIVAWKKFGSLEDPEEVFVRWLCVIARYEILMFRRSRARDRLVLNDELVERIADEGIEESEDRTEWIRALNGCLQKLPEERRRLVTSAYADGASIKTIAEEMGRKPNALYQTLSRIRIVLADCIEKQIAQTSSLSLL